MRKLNIKVNRGNMASIMRGFSAGLRPSRKFFQVCSAPRTAGYTRNIHTSLRLHNIDEYRKRYDQANSAHEAQMKYRNRTSAYYAASLGIVFLALGFSAVPVYRAVCKRTGWAGTPITDSTKFGPEKVVPVDTNKRIRIQFTCQSSGVLPWKFTPLQREVYVVPGETALAFYRAKNMSNEDIIGMATYTVTPDQVAGYFNKIQCFCFEEQRLSAGEEVDMPVFFFIDPEFAKDPAMRNIDDVVLHYSFFKAVYADGELQPSPVA